MRSCSAAAAVSALAVLLASKHLLLNENLHPSSQPLYTALIRHVLAQKSRSCSKIIDLSSVREGHRRRVGRAWLIAFTWQGLARRILQASSVHIAVSRAGRAWRALGKLPTQLRDCAGSAWRHALAWVRYSVI